MANKLNYAKQCMTNELNRIGFKVASPKSTLTKAKRKGYFDMDNKSEAVDDLVIIL